MIRRSEPTSDTIPATLTAAEAARTRWQMTIVGAGPGGAAAAMRLAERGVRVLLVDRGTMPRWKICGCCLSVTAVRELRSLMRGEPAAAGLESTPLADVHLAAGGRSAQLGLPGGGVMSRETLDAGLVRAAIARGCHWLPQASVLAVHESADGCERPDARQPLVVEVQHDVGRDGAAQGPGFPERHGATLRIETERCVLATGLADAVRLPADIMPRAGRRALATNRIGVGGVLGAECRGPAPGSLVMAVATGGYCGLVRLPDGRVDLAAALDRRLLRDSGSPAAAVATVLEQALGRRLEGLVDPADLAAAEFRATPPLTRSLPPCVGVQRRILRIGDAAGYVEPFTGEGIGWSLASARLLTEAVLDPAGGIRPVTDAAARYVATYRDHFGSLHGRCRRLTRALRRPLLVAATVRAAGYAPWAASRLVPLVIGARGQGAHDPWA